MASPAFENLPDPYKDTRASLPIPYYYKWDKILLALFREYEAHLTTQENYEILQEGKEYNLLISLKTKHNFEFNCKNLLNQGNLFELEHQNVCTAHPHLPLRLPFLGPTIMGSTH